MQISTDWTLGLLQCTSECLCVQEQRWWRQCMPALAQNMVLSPLNATIGLPAAFSLDAVQSAGSQGCPQSVCSLPGFSFQYYKRCVLSVKKLPVLGQWIWRNCSGTSGSGAPGTAESWAALVTLSVQLLVFNTSPFSLKTAWFAEYDFSILLIWSESFRNRILCRQNDWIRHTVLDTTSYKSLF